MCAPVLSGLAAAIQLPALPAGRSGPVRAGPVHPVPAPSPCGVPAPPRPIPPLFLHGIRPALEAAFGTEDAELAPDAIAALVARLHTGPLGPAQAEASPAVAVA